MTKSPKILLRSSWQTVNIGDTAHTPGLLALLEEYIPQAEIILWPSNVGEGVRETLLARFPSLEIVENQADKDRALQTANFFLHGSGPNLVGRQFGQKP